MINFIEPGCKDIVISFSDIFNLEIRAVLTLFFNRVLNHCPWNKLSHNTKHGSNWDSVWETTRQKKLGAIYSKKKLSIFAVASILDIPKETVRRKIEILKKKKFISYTTQLGLLPTDKIEDIMKPFAMQELKILAKFLQELKKHKALDQLLNFKDL